jgi:opacity protein-like surface antigen
VGKKTGLILFFATVASIFIVNLPSAGAADLSHYVATKVGIYSPQGDALKDFDTGFNGELVFGYRKNKFAIELEVGYFETKGPGTIVASELPLLVIPGDVKISVIPIVLNYKYVYPVGKFEPFVEVGAGVYVTDIDLSGGGLSFSDRYTSPGVHVGLGANLNISQKLFLGIEGRYLWVDEHQFVLGHIPVNVNIDGVIATVNVGYRFDIPSGR